MGKKLVGRRGGSTCDVGRRGGSTGDVGRRGGSTGDVGRRGGSTGDVGMRGGSTGDCGRKGGNTGDGGKRFASGTRDERRDDRGKPGDDRRVVGVNSTRGGYDGRRHDMSNDVGKRPHGRGVNNVYYKGASERGYRSVKASGAIGRGRGDRSLKVNGASGKCVRGGKSVSGGSGSSHVVGMRCFDRYDDDSEDSDYDENNDDGGVSESESEGSEGEGSEAEGEAEDGEARDGDEGGDGEGGNGEGSEDEDAIAQHHKRGYSLGLFGQPPPQPIRIRMVGQVIDSPVGSRTLLAFMRVHWPPGCISAKDVDRRCPKWWRRIRKMFFKYYEFDPEYGTISDACAAVRKHLRRNMVKTLSSERKRIMPLIKANGGSFIDYRPPYFSEAVWEPICKHWESPVFDKRSKAAKQARGKQDIPHTSGATSFLRRAWDLKKKTGKEPITYDLFLQLHTKDKDNTVFTSEAVRVIVERFLDKCKEQKTDPFEASILTWVEAVGVRKNAIIGIPGACASEIIPLPPGKRRRRRCVDDESGASTGRSVIEQRPNDSVMHAVDRTVAFASANPDQFNLTPEQVKLLAPVAEGGSDLPVDHPLTMTTMRELVQVMVAVLADVHAKQNATNNSDKGKSVSQEENDSNRD